MSTDIKVATSPSLAARLLGNGTWNVVAHVVYTGLAIASGPLYIHYLGVDKYGLLTLLSALLAPLGLVNLGYGQALVKFVAESRARGQDEYAAEHVSVTLAMNAILGVVGCLSIVVLGETLIVNVFKIAPAEHEEAIRILEWLTITWAITQVGQTFVGVATALQNFQAVSLGTLAAGGASIGLGVIALVGGGDLMTVVQVRMVVTLTTAAFWYLLAKHLLPAVTVKPIFSRRALTSVFHFGSLQTVAGGAGLIAGQADKILLGMYLSPEAVGVYGISSLVYQSVYALVQRGSEVLFPAMSDLQGRGKSERLSSVLMRSSWVLTTTMVCIMGSIMVFSNDILRLYVGREVAESAAPVLQVMGATGIISSSSIGLYQYLLGTGRIVWITVTTVSNAALAVAVASLLIPHFGLNGAAWGALLALVLSRPIIHLLIWKSVLRHDVSLKVAAMHTYLAPGVGLVAAVVLSWVRVSFALEPGLLEVALGMACCSIFLIIAVLLSDAFFDGSAHRRQDIKTVIIGLVATAYRPAKPLVGRIRTICR